MTEGKKSPEKIKTLAEEFVKALEETIDAHEAMMHHATYSRLNNLVLRFKQLLKEICQEEDIK